MLLNGRTVVAASVEDLWQALERPERLAAALPGVSQVSVDGDRISASVEPRTGMGATPFALRLEVTERRPPDRIAVRGTGRGDEYAADLEASFELTGEAAGTAVSWRAEVEVRGVLGSVAQRVLPGVVAAQVEQLVEAARADSV